MPGRIVVLISGSGTNMDALASACERGEVPGRITAVVADRDCLGLRLAEKRGIPTIVVEPAATQIANNGTSRDGIGVAAQRPDLIVSAGFMRILSPTFVEAFTGRLINLHPSLLPAFPGTHGVRDALAAGVPETGSTVHFIDNEVDHGDVIMQRSVAVLEGDDAASLHERIKEVEHRMLPEACRLILEGKVAP